MNAGVATSADEPGDWMEALLLLGERQGYLTYEMLNERLPDHVTSPEKLDILFITIDRRGIRLIDEADAPQQ